jgi:hypothetical protein
MLACRFKHFRDISIFPDALQAASLVCVPLRETPDAAMERIASIFVLEPVYSELS